MGINPFGVLKALLIKQEGTTTPTSIQITPGGTAGTQTNIVGNQTTTRTLTLPDATDTLAGVAATQTLTNKTFDSTSTATGIKMASFTPDGTNTITVPAGSPATLATIAGVQTFSNKTLDNSNALTIKDGSLTLQNTGDVTKIAQISASGLTTGTTRVYSLPDATTTLVGTGVAQTLTNKTFDSTSTATGIKLASFTPDGTHTLTAPGITDTLTTNTSSQTLSNKTFDNTTVLTVKDSSLAIDNAADTTKVAKFDASSITTGNTRTYTLPDATTTLVGTGVTQTLTNKTADYTRITATSDSTSTGTLVTLTATTSGFVRLTNVSLASIAGIPAGVAGQRLTLENLTGSVLTIANLNVGTTASTQIVTGTNSSVTMSQGAIYSFFYDTSANSSQGAWVLEGSAASTSASTVNYITNGNAEQGGITGWTTYSDTQTATITIATPAVFTVSTTTSMYIGQPHHFTTTGALPTGLTAGTTYYVSAIPTSTTFRVSATLGGADVATSGTQSGTHTDRPMTPMTTLGTSPVVTWTTSSTTPLRGSNSFIMTKDAADRAGEGVYYQFQPALEDQAKVLQIQIPYVVGSGTFNAGSPTTDSDVEVFIYDLTNSKLVQPTTYKLFSNSSTVPSALIANFQTNSTTTVYRLVVHTVGTNSSAYTLKFDDIVVSPTQYSLGTLITDWQSYTPTFVGFGTVTSPTYLYRRVGGSIELVGTHTVGTPTAVTASLSLPTGINASSSLPSVSVAGVAVSNSAVAMSIYMLATPSTNVLNFGRQDASNAGYTAITGSGLAAASSIWSVRAEVPVLGWAVQQQTSDINDQRSTVASVKTPTSSLTSSFSDIFFGTVDQDTHSAYNSSTGVFTVPTSGSYDFSANLETGGTFALNTDVELQLLKNGSSIRNSRTYSGGVETAVSVQLHASGITCLAGDLIKFQAKSTATSPTYTGTTFCYASFKKQGNPAQISSTETIAASYWLSASQTATTSAPINYDQKEFDTHGAVTTGSAWKFTAPIRGLYQLDISIASSTASINVWSIYKNGTGYKNLTLTASTFATGNASTAIYLNGGDFIDIRPGTSMAMTTSATLFTTANDVNTISIKKIGI